MKFSSLTGIIAAAGAIVFTSAILLILAPQPLPSVIQPPAQYTPLLTQPTPPTGDETANLLDEASAMAGWKLYRNGEVGIEFRYPPELGELTIREEQCLPADGPTREYQGEPCVGISTSIFTAQSRLFATYGPGRGASYGDIFSLAAKNQKDFSVEDFVKNYCSSSPSYR